MNTICLIHASVGLPPDLRDKFRDLRRELSVIPGWVMLDPEPVSVSAADLLVVLLDHGSFTVWEYLQLRFLEPKLTLLFFPAGKTVTSALTRLLEEARAAVPPDIALREEPFPDPVVYDGSAEIVAEVQRRFPMPEHARKVERIYH